MDRDNDLNLLFVGALPLDFVLKELHKGRNWRCG
jgi:hypothetical protein